MSGARRTHGSTRKISSLRFVLRLFSHLPLTVFQHPLMSSVLYHRPLSFIDSQLILSLCFGTVPIFMVVRSLFFSVVAKRNRQQRLRQVSTNTNHRIRSSSTRQSYGYSSSCLLCRAMTSTSGSATSLPRTFTAWRVEETSHGTYVGSDQTLSLPSPTSESDKVLIRVTHSSLNYKDALSAAGNKGEIGRAHV